MNDRYLGISSFEMDQNSTTFRLILFVKITKVILIKKYEGTLIQSYQCILSQYYWTYTLFIQNSSYKVYFLYKSRALNYYLVQLPMQPLHLNRE